MSTSLLLSLEGWPNSPSTDNVVQSYNNDSGIWVNTFASPPFVGKVISSSNRREGGGWDGNRWYVVSPTGGLYAYTPTTNTWSGILAGSGSIINGTVEDTDWVMCSDGAYVYILSDANDFRRYDPSLDTLTSLSTPPGASYAF